jgi:hypothetical protein
MGQAEREEGQRGMAQTSHSCSLDNFRAVPELSSHPESRSGEEGESMEVGWPWSHVRGRREED